MSETSTKPTWQSYDDEFTYDDGVYNGEYNPNLDLESRVGQIMREVEEQSDIVKSSQQTREEFCRQFERNVESRKPYQFPNQEELKLQREGQILHMNTFLQKLRKCGLNCWYSEKGGMAGTLGLYVGHDKSAKCSHEYGQPHYVAFVQVPFMQEYEELFFDRYNVPLGIKRRGWRTVLLRGIEQGLLTTEQVDKVFGKPATGPVSRRYQEYVSFLQKQKG